LLPSLNGFLTCHDYTIIVGGMVVHAK